MEPTKTAVQGKPKAVRNRNAPVRKVTETFASEVARLARIRPDLPRKSKPAKVQAGFDLQLIFDDVLDSFRSMTNRPLVVLSLLFVAGIVTTHTTFNNGAIGKWVEVNQRNNTLAGWIHENQMKFLGGVIFTPALLDLPKLYQVPVFIGTILWIMLVPEYSVYQYLIQAVALHTFFRVKRSHTRTAIILVVAFCYYFGFIAANVKTK